MWQLVSHGSVLGTTGPELPVAAGTTRAWPLLPAPAFDSVQHIFEALAELQRAELSRVPPELLAIADDAERDRAIRSWVKSNPEIHRQHVPPPEILAIADATERVRAIQAWGQSDPERRRRLELFSRFIALELRLVNDDGTTLPTSSIAVTPVPPLGASFLPSMDDDFLAAGFTSGPPFYMVVASMAG